MQIFGQIFKNYKKRAGASGLDSIIYIIYNGPLIDTNKGVTGEGENDESSSPDKAIVTHVCTQQCILLIIVSKPFPLFFLTYIYFIPGLLDEIVKARGGTEMLLMKFNSLIGFGRSPIFAYSMHTPTGFLACQYF